MDISKEAVEHMAWWLGDGGEGPAVTLTRHQSQEAVAMLYALLARVEELEANNALKADFVEKTINDSAATYEAGFNKGLEEAIAAIQESCSRNDVYSKSRTDAVKAIKALKTDR